MKKPADKPFDLSAPGMALLGVLIAFAALAILAGVVVLAVHPGV